MPQSSSPAHRSKIISFAHRRAPYSIVDLASEYANLGYVSECAKAGNRITGIVRDKEDLSHPVSLEIIRGQDIYAECSCSTREEMAEQWCVHTVALLMRSSDLGFFELYSGFAASESVLRMNTSSPSEIAEVIREVGQQIAEAAPLAPYHPEVAILLNLASDRLGVKVLFDGDEQGPKLFEGFERRSARELDNLLLRILDEEGNWDDSNRQWFINSSTSIEKVLGLLREFGKVVSVSDKKPVKYALEALEAQLQVVWQEGGAELTIQWLLADKTLRNKESELFGTGPYWVAIENTVYRLSATATRIASIFPYGPVLRVGRSQIAPLLEVLCDLRDGQSFITMRNPELMPETKVKLPAPFLSIEQVSTVGEHFVASDQLDLVADLQFRYPPAPENKNVVYLPNRAKEKEYAAHLRTIGFKYLHEQQCYAVTGDAALDLLQAGSQAFPDPWQVEGLETLRQTVRFADLNLNVSFTGSNTEEQAGTNGGRNDWFDCHVSLVQNNSNIPLSVLFKNAKPATDRWIRLESGYFGKVPGGGLTQLKTILGMLDPHFRLTNTIKTRLSVPQAISFSRVEDPQFKLSLDTRLRTLSKKLAQFEALSPLKPNKNFVGALRNYQEEGLAWLQFLYDFDLDGILADEMGLGKTVQALAFLQLLKDKKKRNGAAHRPSLVVAPTSVITNWWYEAKRFTPKLRTLLLHGPDRKKHFSTLNEYDIIITSYALLRLDRYELERLDFNYVLLDEAQNIKNPLVATTRAAKSLRAQRRLALTGTPTENRPLELWSIIDFLMPGYLGSVDFFRTYIEKPIIEGGTNIPVAKFLHAKTRPFILRRTKAEVEKDLPAKVESNLHVSMTQSQRDLYAQIVEEVRPKVMEAVSKKGIRGATISILTALLRLRQVCNHPNSIEALKELDGFDSGKFNLLKDLVEEALESGRKILVFSQFREMLAIIRRWLEETKVNYLYLDGTVKHRQPIIDEFNNNDKVRLFLISLKAGGTGLNLTAADTVIIYDPWWNPAVESQAVDRAHRIGQTKKVSVYRLVTENSIEQKIMNLKARKAKLVAALINEDSLSPLNLSKAELESLFSFDIAPEPES